MTFSQPVIATAHGGPLEIIEDGISGFLVPPDNPPLLSQKIEYLKTHPEISTQIGDNARKRVEQKFSLEINVRKIEQLYGTV